MAQVFLSYDHDDAAKARTIALALERAGHSVWWDLHIRSGAQFSKVIEQSLKAADAVVVLWSAHSVESPWVRDEAAAGRDSQRLVPARLDGTELPLGFRQFQTVDLSGWKGRGSPPALRALLADIEAVATGDAGPAEPRPVPATRAVGANASHRRHLIAVVGALAALGAAGFYWMSAGTQARSITVVVSAADPSAMPVARNLLLDLGNLRSVQGGSVQLVGEAGRQRPDLILEANVAGTNQPGATLAFMSGRDRAILWSKVFAQDGGTFADLKLRMAYTAGRVLGCAVEGLEPGQDPLPTQAIKLYLKGCSELAEASSESMVSVASVFEDVVEVAPEFKPAWAKLLVAEVNAVARGAINPPERARLQRHIASARKVDPQLAEAILAEAILLPADAYGEGLRLLDIGLERDPDNTELIITRTQALLSVGRLGDAIDDAEKAARLDPTSPDTLFGYVITLAHAGRLEAARAEMQRAERLWQGTEKLRELQYAFNLRYGDPKKMMNSKEFKQSNPRMQMYYRTRANPTPANIDRFMAFLQGLYSRRGLTRDDVVGHSQAYGEFHREDRLYELIFRLPSGDDLSPLSGVIFRPSLRKFRHDPRFMIVAKRVGLVDYWTKSGNWPDFCFDPDQPYDCKVVAAKLN